ncbi:MAG: wax ester/triacylglycerol synthase family O-acyltransferase [Hyphomicrobiales bacterium]
MAPIDTTWLRMDRPTNLMVIVGVLVLAGPVDVSLLQDMLAERLLAIPRFRQRTETRETGTWWCDDRQFDLTRHLKRTRLPGAADKAELEQFVAGLAATPLDPLHPLWQFHIVEDYEGGAAIVSRIHHAIADGMALIGVLLSLTDGHGGAAARRARHVSKEDHGSWLDLIAPVMEVVGEGLRLSGKLLRGSVEAATHPARTLEEGTDIAAELAHLLLMPNDSPTRFKGQLSGVKRVAWTDPIALPEVKAVSRALGCSVNDMLLAAVAGALNGYLAEKGDETKGVEIRALVPVNLRAPGSERELGNQFGVVALELPIGLENPLARLQEVHRRMEALKGSYEPPVTLGLLSTLGYAPKLVQDKVFNLLLSRATAVMTNVPGPQQPLYLAGSEIKQVMVWVPQAGDIGMGVSILSFNGKVQFGLLADAALVPDPHGIVARFKPEFEQLLYFVLMQAWAVIPEQRPVESEPGAVKRAAGGTRRGPPSSRGSAR